jgi:glutathione peroxidase-family protein
MTIFDVDIDALTGGPAGLDQFRGPAVLVVNVASKCGMTPQYAGLQSLWAAYRDRGLNGEDIQSNFEKFLVTPDGQVACRFGPGVPPDDPELVAALEKLLPR